MHDAAYLAWVWPIGGQHDVAADAEVVSIKELRALAASDMSLFRLCSRFAILSSCSSLCCDSPSTTIYENRLESMSNFEQSKQSVSKCEAK